MKTLHQRILLDGQALSDQVLKVDAFLNHQVDPMLTMDIGREFANVFQSEPITKVLTIEASGIHFALATAAALQVPFLYAKKKKAVTLTEELYTAEVFSFTRQETFQVSVSKRYLHAHDRVLIIDDFLATGDALLGLINIVQQAGAHLVGVGAVIEKSFQDGRSKLEAAGARIHSLARIASMSPNHIEFLETSDSIAVPTPSSTNADHDATSASIPSANGSATKETVQW
ncbi:xanthine phosphoribosyltransferase [Tumebacillus algifaecis]|uniref:Xanthine phosphoribosyltransferase n=1 Tax=Tumebacillus algifaecis TaxID=1214604 RepID=A0A223CWT2_9BACL|nr:xanthine phosphoribosyltransferase [Tumebacillus algifaecis]ASS73742.1 xanthine phosphoribosyltransferase [Tumebacillus algifaecis]